MKTKLLSVCIAILFAFNIGYSQTEFWGTLRGNGESSKGALFKTDSAGKNLQIEYDFTSYGGQHPEYSRLCEASNGKLYGMTSFGGKYGLGIIFEYDPVNETYLEKFDFVGNTGSNPYGSLVKGPNGLLYGLTNSGGANGFGVIFEYDPITNKYVKKFDFGNNYGEYPYGSLTWGNNGKFYGMTSSGGSFLAGVLFEFDPYSGICNKKVDFDNTNGASPYGDLTMAANGKMYGMTTSGGMGYGTLFEYNVGADSVSKKVDFDFSFVGSNPYGSLLLSSSGNLYGMASSGGTYGFGVIFEYFTTGDSIHVKFNFDDAIYGSYPYGNLMEDSAGRFYGMTSTDGIYFSGTLFEFYPLGDSCQVRAYLGNGINGGSYPEGTLMQTSNNRIFGLTNQGGLQSVGILFEFDPALDTIIKKVDFNPSYGDTPNAGLIKATNGKFYGATVNGGKSNNGVLYEYDPATRKYSKLFDFDYYTSGSNPQGELMQATNGKLYGMASSGGAHGSGTLFEFDLATNQFLTLHDFDTATGYFPKGRLTQVGDTLYGMTNNGGLYYCGVIFKYAISSGIYTVLLHFDSSTYGSYPSGSLVLANNGKLYGMANSGGLMYSGTLFEYDLSTNTCFVKINFDGTNGAYPLGSLIQAVNDSLYGMTSGGGQNGMGTLFKYNIFTGLISYKASFNGTNGSYPAKDLIEAGNGKLYGLTQQGGLGGSGVLFEFDPTIDSLKVASDLGFQNGYSGGSLLESGCYAIYDTAFASICNGDNYIFGTQTLTADGVYTETFVSATGCDSIVTLYLTVGCPSKTEFWGMTPLGGANGVGTIYKTDDKGSVAITEYSFVNGAEGYSPYGGLIQAKNGKLYGMTAFGGTNDLGTLFEYNPALKAYTKLFDFDGAANGSIPSGELIQLPNGKLYGMTEEGGTNNAGVIFEFDPTTNSYLKKIDFDSVSTGARPMGTLMLANNGMLYGVTYSGGGFGLGVLFEYDNVGNTCVKKYEFDGSTNGSNPAGGLIQANNGLIYGEASKGGVSNYGLLFSYDIYSTTYTKVYEFSDGLIGINPQGKLLQASNGLLYGVAAFGGSYNNGTLFNYDFYNSYCNLIQSFDSTMNTGQHPHGALTQTNNGVLLGTATNGGTTNNGVIFIYNLDSNMYHVGHNFNGADGSQPYYGALVKVNAYSIYDTVSNTICEGDTIYFGPQILTTTGTYTQVFTATSGVDSTVVIYLTVNPVYTVNLNESICDGGNYVLGTQTLTSTGTYTEVFSSLTGCDSVVTVNLTVNPVYVASLSASICDGDSYILGTQTLTTSGQYTELFSSATGCDSTVVVDLTVNPVFATADSLTICKGDSYTFGTQTLTDAGIYNEVFASVSGCDSTVTLTLKVDSLPLKPMVPAGMDLVDNTIGSTDYTVADVANAESYSWLLEPADAGSILPTGTTAMVLWSSTYSGTAKIFVKGINHCGEGPYSDSLMVTVTANPVADFNYVVNGFDVNFINTSINTDGYFWAFGDGNYSQAIDTAYTYQTSGYYTVCLKAKNTSTGQVDEKCVDLIIGDTSTVCSADFDYLVNGGDVKLTNTSSAGYSDVFWDFDDGQYSTLDDTLHHYTSSGYYNISLTIYNSGTNCMDEVTKTVEVLVGDSVLCDAQFSYYGNQNDLTFYNGSQGNPTAYFWDFGDGNYSVVENPEHHFDSPGYYEVSLTIFNDTTGCMDENMQVIYVYNPDVATCNAQFSYYPEGYNIYFTSQAVGDYSQYFWDFDDGKNSNQENPVHTFAKSGYYEVSFTVKDTLTSCFDTRSKVIYVQGDTTTTSTTALKARFDYFPDDSSNRVAFTDKSIGNVIQWYWDFGDNSEASTLKNPTYTYATNDYYRVCLTVSNDTKQKTKCKFIAVGDVSNSSTAFFTYFADSLTSTGHFKNKSLGNIVEYEWDFGDGNSSDQKDPSHTYADTGYYAVCLTTVSASGVSKTYCNDVRIGNALANPCLYSCVWPGDANNDLEANHYDVMTIGLNYDLQGPRREDASTNWYGQFAQNWSTFQLDGTNNKHGDCNGDGIINYDDITAIEQNFAYSHYRQPDVKNADWQISCQWSDEVVKSAGARSKAKAILLPPSGKDSSTIYAIGYEIEVIGGEKVIWKTISIDFSESWLGVEGNNMITVFETDSTRNMIYIGMARTDHQDTSGQGIVASLIFDFKEGFTRDGVSFNVTTRGGIVSTGDDIPVAGSIELDLGLPIEVCQGEPAIIDAGSGFASYTWSNGLTDTSRIAVEQPGYYTVTVTNESGSSAIDSVEVIVHDLPQVDLGDDITRNDSTLLDAGSGYSSYLWSTGDTIQAMQAKETGWYWVDVFNEYGCNARDSIYVTIVTDIYDTHFALNIDIFPNPNNGKFRIDYQYPIKSDIVLEILDVDGRAIWRKEYKQEKNINELISPQGIKEGVYLLKLIRGNDVQVLRFVVL